MFTSKIVEERKGKITFVNLPANGLVSYPANSYVQLTNYAWNNSGLEGIAYDKTNNIIYAIKEKTPMTLLSFTVPSSFPATILANELIISNTYSVPLTDLAGLHIAPNNNLILLSQNSSAVIEIDPTTGMEVSALILDNMPQPSGVATDDACNLYVVSEPMPGNTSSLLYKYAPNCIDPSLTACVLLSPKVFLQGPLSGTTMNTALMGGGMIPGTSPYDGTALVGTAPSNAVDWVMVEIRSDDTASPAQVHKASGLLLDDGTVVAPDGSSALSFPVAPGQSWFIVVKHRNHLGVMTSSPVTLN